MIITTKYGFTIRAPANIRNDRPPVPPATTEQMNRRAEAVARILAFASDQRNAGMSIRAHWRWYVDPTVLVYDVRGVGGATSRVDVVRALLQFAYRQKDRTFGRVDLASGGSARFSLDGRDFAALGREYPYRSPVDQMRLVPAMLRRPDGSRAFASHEGDPGAQAADADAFVDQWVAKGR